MTRRSFIALLALLAVTLTGLPAAAGDRFITVASTTSTEDSGLFGYLLPMFTEKTGIEVRVVALGTGQALQPRKRRLADEILDRLLHLPSSSRT